MVSHKFRWLCQRTQRIEYVAKILTPTLMSVGKISQCMANCYLKT